MKPHMAHINNTLIKKQLADEAKDVGTAYKKYRAKVDKAIEYGYPKTAIVAELEDEIVAIKLDRREGERIFQEGVQNAKAACVAAIRAILSELKGEN